MLSLLGLITLVTNNELIRTRTNSMMSRAESFKLVTRLNGEFVVSSYELVVKSN
ncbi:hypothetical protein MNV_640012 [Candidatus Methanoperedens nitroreducens]|uniref:Uncharacterized protein n=1 Tax=Candidatus Methanoperedens nitratireducens TaxID=1392998 RepID=A0A284VSI1_9EURY|nr:hypothetical protein MNV_640012 [Candidatus Methanoperedens nitroreducens]